MEAVQKNRVKGKSGEEEKSRMEERELGEVLDKEGSITKPKRR